MATPTREKFAEALADGPVAKVLDKSKIGLIGFGIVFIVGILLAHSLFDTTNAGFIKIRQAAGTGTITVHDQPGMFLRLGGDITTYKKSDIIYFSKHDNEGKALDESVGVKFNDGATAQVTGNVRIELPSDPEKLKNIHVKFRSYDALINDTVKQVVAESTILTAALMTAEESYTTKRAEFSQLAYDQLLNGVYLTEAKTITVKDKATGESVDKEVVQIARDEKGLPLRKESVLAQYGIRVSQFVIKEIDYEATVEGQIQAKQQAIMQVVSAKAQAEKAVQDRLTAEEVGRKNVAVAKYEQEVKKATAVTAAEQELAVATLHKQSEEQTKLANIANGEGEGTKKRLIYQADGALTQKLDAYVKTQQAWAEAFANSKNPVVPGVIMGAQSGNGSNAATTMMDLMGIQAAKALSLDTSLPKKQ